MIETNFPMSIIGLSLEQLKNKIKDAGMQPFVAGQLWDWIYKKNKLTFEEMVNISKQNQLKLKEVIEISPFKAVELLPSGEGRAIKLIITLKDNKKIESVILKERDYYTLCVSSQCGCPVDCKFCLTGIVGFTRNLEVDEIIGQVLVANSLGYHIGNLVFMGMGEPMLNFDNVFEAIDFMTSLDTMGMSKRRVTVSTSGFIKNIQRLIDEKRYINLAFSVGHANPEKRVRLMPIEKKNPIMEVATKLHEYQSLHNRKLTLEYTLIDGMNEDDQAIRELARLAKYLDAKVNLINLNPHHKIPFKPVSTKVLHRARVFLERENVPVTIRFRKGDDISAACGQLGESHLAPKTAS